MGKKVLGTLFCLCIGFTLPAYALSVDLSLFSGGLSVLDSLFLIGAGLTMIGVLFLCLAFFKPEKALAVEEFEEEEPLSVEEEIALDEEEESQEEPPADTVAEAAVMEEVIAQEAMEEWSQDHSPKEEEEPLPAELQEEEPPVEAPQEEEEPLPAELQEEEGEEESTEEKTYPALTLTGMNHSEFKILPLKETVSLGRRPGNDLVFAENTVSGLHCTISVEDGEVYLEDQNSTNGTYLNRQKLTEKTAIHKGDILALGKLEFKINL